MGTSKKSSYFWYDMALLKDMEPVMIQRRFYDTEDRFNKLDEKDPLPKLNESINWSIFRPLLNKT